MNKKETYADALRHFKKNDRVFYNKIKHIKLTPLKKRSGYTPYTYLLRSIISQQISTKAAASIMNKFTRLFPDERINFDVLAQLSDQRLKSAGISPQKLKYMRDLTEKITNSQLLEPRKLLRMTDAKIIEHLIQVKGIGEWTVQMLLIFFLHRRDVMPARDLGIQKGYQGLYRKKHLPKEQEILRKSKKWSPYSSIASLYLWAFLDAD